MLTVLLFIGLFCGRPAAATASPRGDEWSQSSDEDGALEVGGTTSAVNFTGLSRANLCDRSIAVVNGSLSIADALQGSHLTFSAALHDEHPEYLACDQGGECNGFHADLLKELALHAGFTYTIEATPSNAIDRWHTWLLDSVHYTDANMDFWMRSAKRSQHGVTCPHAFMDMSIISATLGHKDRPTIFEDLTRAYTGPFEVTLWITLVAITVATSAIYFWLEGTENDTDCPPEATPMKKVMGVMYLGAAQCVAHATPAVILHAQFSRAACSRPHLAPSQVRTGRGFRAGDWIWQVTCALVLVLCAAHRVSLHGVARNFPDQRSGTLRRLLEL